MNFQVWRRKTVVQFGKDRNLKIRLIRSVWHNGLTPQCHGC